MSVCLLLKTKIIFLTLTSNLNVSPFFKMILPVKAGCQLLTKWRPFIMQSSVRHVIAGRSRSETPQAVPDGLLNEDFCENMFFMM
jgi:hypothetical protein